MIENIAILDENDIVISLFEGNIHTTDTTTIENYYGHVKYSTPFEYRGVPIVGSTWNGLTNKFE
jgi:hypothetical protein